MNAPPSRRQDAAAAPPPRPCSRCMFAPPCATYDEMVRRHGAVEKFIEATFQAFLSGSCTEEEAASAIAVYSHDLARAQAVRP